MDYTKGISTMGLYMVLHDDMGRYGAHSGALWGAMGHTLTPMSPPQADPPPRTTRR